MAVQELDEILGRLAAETGKGEFDEEDFETSLREIQSRALHIDAMNCLLRDMIRAIDGADIFTSGAFLELASANGFSLSLIRYTGQTKYIYSSPVAFSQMQLSSGACSASWYRLLGRDPLNDVFDSSRKIELSRRQLMSQQDVLSKDHSDIIDFTEFDCLPLVTLRLSTPPSGSYEWAFDRKTLRAQRYSTLLLTESNLCGIFDLLSEVGDDQTEDFLDRYSSHEYHFVRWKAVQSLAALNPERALGIVRKLVDDGHPDVRHAAQATLAMGALGVE